MRGWKTIAVASAALALAAAAGSAQSGLETAIFAGGRFWNLQTAFERLHGVLSIVGGYSGGTGANPTAATFAAGGHVEAVRVVFDPTRIGYRALLESFWRNTDPTDAGGQFLDRGPQYRTMVLWLDDGQRRTAEESKASLSASGRLPGAVVTEIRKAGTFHKADESLQEYRVKNQAAYNAYRLQSGRDGFLSRIWGSAALADPTAPPALRGGSYAKPPSDRLRKTLTPLQYEVTQEEGTERPYVNAYWDNHAEGIYVDVVSGEPLFSSTDKYESDTGWPSFTMPLAPGNVVLVTDGSYGMVRTEVRSRYADSHLGHLFDDGPDPTGLRYCMNSASLRFVPAKDLSKEGYGSYESLFKK